MKKIFLVSMIGAAVFILEGCAPRIGGNNYSLRGAGEINNTHRGVVVSKHNVTISAKDAAHENDPGVGSLVGGVAGAVGGSQIGGGRGSLVAGGLGALAGAVGGHFAERALTDQEGVEYQVRLDNGRLLTLAQGADPMIGVGQRILLIESSKDRARIVPE